MNGIRANLLDFEPVAQVLSDPEVWPSISDDFSPVFDKEGCVEILSNDKIYVLMPNEASVFVFIPINHILYDSHIAIKTDGRGKWGYDGTRRALTWMFEQTPCLKIVGRFNVNNIRMLWLAKLMKFTIEGICRKSLMIHGSLADQIMIGLSKEDWLKP